MKTWSVFAISFVFVACFAIHAETTPSADEHKLIALENAWNQAQLHHDAGSLDSLMAEHFVYTDYDGTFMDKTGYMADIRDPNFRATLIENEDVKVYMYPGAAIVAGIYHTKGTYKGKPFDHRGRFTDTWIYQNNLWQCVASHTNLLSK
jgi:Domain of unknown function (DUF4440)